MCFLYCLDKSIRSSCGSIKKKERSIISSRYFSGIVNSAFFSHSFNKIKFDHNSSYQVSETIKVFDDNQDDLDYTESIKWYNNNLEYILNDRGMLVFKHDYKKTLLENYKEIEEIESYQSESSVGVLYNFFDNIKLNIFFDVLTYNSSNKSLPGIKLTYNKQQYSISVGKENDVLSSFYERDNAELYYYYTATNFTKSTNVCPKRIANEHNAMKKKHSVLKKRERNHQLFLHCFFYDLSAYIFSESQNNKIKRAMDFSGN